MQLVFVSILQKLEIFYMEVYYEELTQTIMEAEKSPDLSFARWRPGYANSAIQSKSEDLRTRGGNGVNPSPRAGEE